MTAPTPGRIQSTPARPASAAREWLREDELRKLYRRRESDPAVVRAVLDRVCAEQIELVSSYDRLTRPRRARIAEIRESSLELRFEGTIEAGTSAIPLRVDVGGVRWFFVALPLERRDGRRVLARLPSVLYEPERRDLARVDPSEVGVAPTRVEIASPTSGPWRARVLDWSYHGMRVELPGAPLVEPEVEVRYLDGPGTGSVRRAWVRHRSGEELPMRLRLGMETSEVARPAPLPVEHRERLEALETWPARTTGALGRRFRAEPQAPEIPLVDFRNRRGERIRGILDRSDGAPGAPLVLIPPAWGRTKETVAALALTILETFRSIGEPVSVLRFDGTRRRGESYRDPDCLAPGDECLRFTFSDAVEDIEAALDFVESHPSLRPSSVVIVSSSLASIDVRRAVAKEGKGRISGWVALVGLVDLHAVMCAVSGGIDYGLGALRGVRFGVQDFMGAPCDIDRFVSDAIESGLWFREDARRDLAAIRVPVIWIHGRYDAWTSLESVREVLASGDASQRRIIEIPIGHQMRASEEALQVYALMASEIGRMLLGRTVAGRVPEANALQARERAERARLPLPYFDLPRFWRDYLVGRSGRVGMELLTATAPYQELLTRQVEALRLREGAVVADLGSGTGDLAVHLGKTPTAPAGLRVVALDLVRDGLLRQRERLEQLGEKAAPRVGLSVADLSVRAGSAVPLRSESCDAVLASLLLTYLSDPEAFLRETHRILRRGGRLVLSAVKPDADVSKLYMDSLAELLPDRLEQIFGSGVTRDVAHLRQTFLSDAARIIDLEEFGFFHFWDASALTAMVRKAGFVDVGTRPAFGAPPQATVLWCVKP